MRYGERIRALEIGFGPEGGWRRRSCRWGRHRPRAGLGGRPTLIVDEGEREGPLEEERSAKFSLDDFQKT